MLIDIYQVSAGSCMVTSVDFGHPKNALTARNVCVHVASHVTVTEEILFQFNRNNFANES